MHKLKLTRLPSNVTRLYTGQSMIFQGFLFTGIHNIHERNLFNIRERREETTSAGKGLHGMPTTIYVEKKMGKELGRGKILQ